MSAVKVVGIAAASSEVARTLCDQLDLPHAYSSYEEMLADPAVQAVYIAAPIPERYGLVTEALMANKHVLCDAPVAPNARQARDAVVLAAQMRRSLVEHLGHRHHPLTERVRDLIHANAIGQPRHITITTRLPYYFSSRGTDPRLAYSEGGGAMMSLGYFSVNYLRHVLGSELTVAAAKARLSEADPKYVGRVVCAGSLGRAQGSMLPSEIAGRGNLTDRLSSAAPAPPARACGSWRRASRVSCACGVGCAMVPGWIWPWTSSCPWTSLRRWRTAPPANSALRRARTLPARGAATRRCPVCCSAAWA